MNTIGAVAIGGAFGAVLRYGVNIASVAMFGHGYPWGTLIVNIVGSFAMGVLIAALAHYTQPAPFLKPFLVTGLLGAFTTFSTFSLDTVSLWERGLALQSAGYIFLSVILSVGALLSALILTDSLNTGLFPPREPITAKITAKKSEL